MEGKFFKVTKSEKETLNLGKVGVFIKHVDLGEDDGVTVLGYGDGVSDIFDDGTFEMEEVTDLNETFNENALLSIKEYQDEFVENEKKIDELVARRKKIINQLSIYAKKLD